MESINYCYMKYNDSNVYRFCFCYTDLNGEDMLLDTNRLVETGWWWFVCCWKLWPLSDNAIPITYFFSHKPFLFLPFTASFTTTLHTFSFFSSRSGPLMRRRRFITIPPVARISATWPFISSLLFLSLLVSAWFLLLFLNLTSWPIGKDLRKTKFLLSGLFILEIVALSGFQLLICNKKFVS